MSLYDERVADLQEIEAELPNNFEHGVGDALVTGPCIPTGKNAGLQLIVGGKLAEVRRTLFIRCALFSAGTPVKDQPIKFRPSTAETFVEYRIASVITTADGGNYELALASLDKP